MQLDKTHKNPVTQLLGHCARICWLSESGWHSENIQQSLKAFAESLNMPQDKVTGMVRQFAIAAAKKSYVEQAWSPASRLVLSADTHWAEQLKPKPDARPATPSQEPPPKQSAEQNKSSAVTPALQSIKQLVKLKTTTQSDLVNTCLKGLSHDLNLGRVSLLMLSEDKQHIQNRMSLGLEKGSGFRNFKIEFDKSGLLKILLKKPQAIWINKDSLKKYHSLIPSSFLASIMTNDFVAMSLFIGNKPIGIVYADHRTSGNHHISAELFTQFKQLISLTSKALTLLAKR